MTSSRVAWGSLPACLLPPVQVSLLVSWAHSSCQHFLLVQETRVSQGKGGGARPGGKGGFARDYQYTVTKARGKPVRKGKVLQSAPTDIKKGLTCSN